MPLLVELPAAALKGRSGRWVHVHFALPLLGASQSASAQRQRRYTNGKAPTSSSLSSRGLAYAFSGAVSCLNQCILPSSMHQHTRSTRQRQGHRSRRKAAQHGSQRSEVRFVHARVRGRFLHRPTRRCPVARRPEFRPEQRHSAGLLCRRPRRPHGRIPRPGPVTHSTLLSPLLPCLVRPPTGALTNRPPLYTFLHALGIAVRVNRYAFLNLVA